MTVMAMPSATGVSMPMRPCRVSRQAAVKKGPAAKISAGMVSMASAQIISFCRSGGMASPPI